MTLVLKFYSVKKNYSYLIEEKAIQYKDLPEELKLYPYKIGKKT